LTYFQLGSPCEFYLFTAPPSSTHLAIVSQPHPAAPTSSIRIPIACLTQDREEHSTMCIHHSWQHVKFHILLCGIEPLLVYVNNIVHFNKLGFMWHCINLYARLCEKFGCLNLMLDCFLLSPDCFFVAANL
jgi:hypothetical protein